MDELRTCCFIIMLGLSYDLFSIVLLVKYLFKFINDIVKKKLKLIKNYSKISSKSINQICYVSMMRSF